MSKRGLKWSMVGVASLTLVAAGAHLAWEQHRYRLVTPRGTIRIGMMLEDVRAVLGPQFGGAVWVGEEGMLVVQLDNDVRVKGASFAMPGGISITRIPRPSLFEHVRSWLGKREE
jgi:hypothetical protein